MPSHKLQKRQVQQQKILRKNLKDNLLKWICEKHALNSPLDRKLLRKKALQLSQSLEVTNFKCSEQWMTTFLKSYGFSTSLTTCTGPYFKDYRLWIDLMRTVLTQYKYKDIFHVDELTMYADIFPLRTDSNSAEDVQDSQVINATNLISILFCCNSSGTDKLSPLISGPYKSNISREDYKYYYNENSCISDQVFADWIITLNQIMSENGRKILLLLHRHRICAVGNTQLSNVKLIFFPANFPPHLRPLRRDVFLSAKMNYRLKYAEKILQPGTKWGLEEMIETVLKSWSEVPRELIISSFQRTTFRSDDKLLEIINDDWEKLNTGISFKNVITFDDHLSDDPNSSSNNPKLDTKEKHKYNLRTSNHQVFQVDEAEDVSKSKSTLQEQYQLKTECSVTDNSQEKPEDDNITSLRGHQENDPQEINSLMDLDREENLDSALKENVEIDLKESISKELEDDKGEKTSDVAETISDFVPGNSEDFTKINKDVFDLVMRKDTNSDLEVKTNNVQDNLMSSLSGNPDEVDIRKRNHIHSSEDGNGPPEKIFKSKKDFNFGPNSQPFPRPNCVSQSCTGSNVAANLQVCPGPSTQNIARINDSENRVSDEMKTEVKSNKTKGFIFTKNGVLSPRISKE